MPLGYLLLQTSDAKNGAKSRYIGELLEYLRDKWNIQPLITLTDKDWSEINAFADKYPAAKHQLCFWHALRAIKTRLSILRRTPAHYNVDEAIIEFHWIDRSFVPISQRTPSVGNVSFATVNQPYYLLTFSSFTGS